MLEINRPCSAPADRSENPEFGVKAGYLMHDVSRLRRAYFDEAMRPHGLTRSQWWVLAQLGRGRGQPMSQVDLARSLDLGKAALGRLIDRLEAGGYVQRQAAPKDRRLNLVAPTERGLRMTDTMRRMGHELNLRVFAGLTDGDVAALEDALGRVKANLLALGRAATPRPSGYDGTTPTEA